MNRDDYVRLDTGNQALQSITQKRIGDRLKSSNTLRLVAQMKETPVESRVIADRRSVEFCGLTQGKTTILFKYIDYFVSITRWSWRVLLFFTTSLLSRTTSFVPLHSIHIYIYP